MTPTINSTAFRANSAPGWTGRHAAMKEEMGKSRYSEEHKSVLSWKNESPTWPQAAVILPVSLVGGG